MNNVTEKAAFLFTHGVHMYQLWDEMDTYNLVTVEDAVNHYFSRHWCECCNRRK